MAVEYQVMIIYAATRKHLMDIPTSDVLKFEADLFKFVDTKYPELPAMIREKRELTAEIEELLNKAIQECKAQR